MSVSQNFVLRHGGVRALAPRAKMLRILTLANPIGVKFVAHVPEFDDFNLIRALPEIIAITFATVCCIFFNRFCSDRQFS